jgi:hypothetical protein
VFDVLIEGQMVASHIDLWSEGGGCVVSTVRNNPAHPVVKKLMATVSDGTLDLRLEGRVDNAKISAIEIISAF